MRLAQGFGPTFDWVKLKSPIWLNTYKIRCSRVTLFALRELHLPNTSKSFY